ncbi:MAG: molybdopterin molybdotransferase MoeA [Rhodospirillales bacterium]|jgi:molybdopterin molybdotransferase|nr:molybdopterin molybdotransferase MoeA [Rhodospirillales bacterium]
MIPVDQALAQVLAGISQLSAEEVGVSDSLGRVLAQDVASRITQPRSDVSAMDGYAVRASDVASVPATLTQIGESTAGGAFGGSVGEGQTVRIFTGAPVPPGADAIVIQEDTERDGDQITMGEAASLGHFIRPAGLDFKESDVLIPKGRLMSARDVSLAAAMNIPWLRVTCRPRIAILSTGNELVLPGEPMTQYQIVSSNSLGLAAFVQAMGGVPINLGIARDEPDELRAFLEGVAGADMLVTIGGASVGDYDLVKSVLGGEGLDITFSKVAMRPGKPLIFGKLGEKPMLGLPGNPVSAGVTALLFLLPAMKAMLGREDLGRAPESAALGVGLGANGERQDYMRAGLSADADGRLTATPFNEQDSSMLMLFAKADCLIIRPIGAPAAKEGEQVPILRLDQGSISV